MKRIFRVLSIAGSDSGGGAGIQADVKTFAAFGVHGMTAITSITAQNTSDVIAIQDVRPDIIQSQIEAVAQDIGVDAAKTGMLHTSEIISVVAQMIAKYGFPTVVDPVMISKSGARLLKPDAIDTLLDKLLPKTTVLTPNAMEAEEISGIEIKSVSDARRAAEKISALGPKAVVVKGGHIPSGGNVVDVLFHRKQFHIFETEKIKVKTTHGTGCCFSSAVAAEIAKGRSIVEAVSSAQTFVAKSVKHGLPIGAGHGPVNPMANLYNDAERYSVIRNVCRAIDILESVPKTFHLVPEVNSNLVMALSYAENFKDVCGVPGRIVKVKGRVRASSFPEFGASRHVANTVLTALKHDYTFRAGINLRYTEETLEICKRMGLIVSYYDRKDEPVNIKKIEGLSTSWGAETAIKRVGRVPNVMYHTGDWGKEAMITVLGTSAFDVAQTVLRIAKALSF
jgi:hydroxymethylpyrimidine/phosphomethylpyrimidine kinase